jgi:hypothetical protein
MCLDNILSSMKEDIRVEFLTAHSIFYVENKLWKHKNRDKENHLLPEIKVRLK